MRRKILSLLIIITWAPILFANDHSKSHQKESDSTLWDAPAELMNSIWDQVVDPVYESVYQKIYRQEMLRALKNAGIPTSNLSEDQLKMIQNYEEMEISPSRDSYSCLNQQRGNSFALLLSGGTGTKSFHREFFRPGSRPDPDDAINRIAVLALKMPACKGVLRFDYDDRQNLQRISHKLRAAIEDLSERTGTHRILMIGVSAGGTLFAQNAAKFSSKYLVEIHTLAAPLKGYSLNRFGDFLISQFAPVSEYGTDGFYRKIGLGIPPYEAPGENVRVLHHKEGKSAKHLISHCGPFRGHCDSLKIQANNVPGAREFYSYGEVNIQRVAQEILDCW